LFLAHFPRHTLQFVVEMKRHTGTDIVDHLLYDKHGPRVFAVDVLVPAEPEPVDARHDDAAAEDATHAVIVDDACERHVVVDVLFAGPLFRDGEIVHRGHGVHDADGRVAPLRGQSGVPLGEVAVDHLREGEDLLGFGLVGGVVGRVCEEVCARAQTGQVDADEGEAVGDVFVAEGAVADPALGAGEVVDGLGALDAACDLVGLAG
jgi:hypothetical protein